MIEVDVPGFAQLTLSHLVLDYNGTLAIDGELITGVAQSLEAIAQRLEVHVLTADTFGKAAVGLESLPVNLIILGGEKQDLAKACHVESLGGDRVVAIGNGRNDRLMLERARIGVAVIQGEGAAGASLLEADIVCRDIGSALELIDHPLRLTATLRS